MKVILIIYSAVKCKRFLLNKIIKGGVILKLVG